MSASDKRHVLISGGSRGLGAALVDALLSEGYRVSTFSRKPTDRTRAHEAEDRFFYAEADAADKKRLGEFVRNAEDRHGPFFGLVNCAGIATDGVLAAMREEEIDRVLSINLAGTLYLSRLVLRRMLLGSSGGSIVNISSIIGIRGYAGLSAYAATKGGMDAITRALAREVGARGIRVNSVAPGYLETEMTHGLSGAQRDQIVRRTPLGRLGTPEDVVGPVLFLLSDASRYMTGQVLVVDGGISS